MAEICPFSPHQINPKAARLNACWTILFALGILISQIPYLALFLTLDFFIRGFARPQWSPLAYLSRLLLKLFKAKRNLVNAGPKIFAAKLGFLMSTAITACYFLGLHLPGLILASLLALLAFMEAAFSFCLGCKIYSLLNHKKTTALKL